jgi:hypothetical protein
MYLLEKGLYKPVGGIVMQVKAVLSALICGVLFGFGLAVSGMTDPQNVLAFLDVFGAWDYRLMFVMGGAVLVTLVGFRLILPVKASVNRSANCSANRSANFSAEASTETKTGGLEGELRKPLFSERFHLPLKTQVDRKLLAGAGLFGIGWGLYGYCPGPALAALVYGHEQTVIFVLAMCAGVFIDHAISAVRRSSASNT